MASASVSVWVALFSPPAVTKTRSPAASQMPPLSLPFRRNESGRGGLAIQGPLRPFAAAFTAQYGRPVSKAVAEGRPQPQIWLQRRFELVKEKDCDRCDSRMDLQSRCKIQRMLLQQRLALQSPPSVDGPRQERSAQDLLGGYRTCDRRVLGGPGPLAPFRE